MAERIKARVGDTVETSFNLVYKKAEVARLPDRDQYVAIDFVMTCDTDGKVFMGATVQPTSHSQIVCAVREVTQDDQPVTAQWLFVPDPATDPNFFKTGDLWHLSLSYVAKDGSPDSNPKSPRVHLLAEVELVAADPASGTKA
jgi:hypothetical protein